MAAKLTSAQVEEIVRLREERRWPAARIAAKYGLSEAGVNYRLLRAGVDPWDTEKNRRKIGNHRGQFSPEEDARMLQLGRDGMAPHKIAIAMGRPKTSVLIRLLTLEVRAEKALEAA